MISAGLCSLTLAALDPAEIVRHGREAGLTHVEWWGKDHVPTGDVERAAAVGECTRAAGLRVSTYGSYYRAGVSRGEGLRFDDVLETALRLGAPAIRVWAGTRGSASCTEPQRQAVVADAQHLAERCASAGVSLVFEYHGGTLTDTDASAAAFADAVRHPAVFFGWQTRPGAGVEESLASLRGILPRLRTLHVFNWSRDADGRIERRPLDEAADAWGRYLGEAEASGRDAVALLEFVRGNLVQQFRQDAGVLKEILSS